MNEREVIDYDFAIAEFLQDVKKWGIVVAKKGSIVTFTDLINDCMYVVSNGGKKLEIKHRNIFATNGTYHDYTVFYGRHRLFSLLKSDTGDEIFFGCFQHGCELSY